jgi:hypothetical protein
MARAKGYGVFYLEKIAKYLNDKNRASASPTPRAYSKMLIVRTFIISDHHDATPATPVSCALSSPSRRLAKLFSVIGHRV